MNKILVKLILIVGFALALHIYNINSSMFQEEIETDNNILEWHNDLLKHKKSSLEHEDKRNKYYHKMMHGLTEKNSFDKGGLIKFADAHKLRDFNIEHAAQYDIEDQLHPLLSNNINISFSCDNEWQIFLLIEEVNRLSSNIMRAMHVANNIDNLTVNLEIQSYYVRNET